MNYIQKIVEDFDFNLIQNNNDKESAFAENVLGVINLGLPSGTLWSKCNLGAKAETEYGNYYAWGELTTKPEYCAENCMYDDDQEQLPPEHDVATQTLGKNYSIPTMEQWDELLKYTDNTWVENYNETGVNGQLFVSKINGKLIFIPAAGVCSGSSLNNNGYYGCVQSSSLDTSCPSYAWCMSFISNDADVKRSNRYNGHSVRPVFRKSKLTENFDFNQIKTQDTFTQALFDDIFEKIVNNTENVTDDEWNLFEENNKNDHRFKYVVKDNTELKRIISRTTMPDLNWLDTINITDMSGIFKNMSTNGIKINEWNTSNVKRMDGTFAYSRDFNSDISNWDVSKVTSMKGMFIDCFDFNQDLSKWNVSQVKNMENMFFGCETFNADISKWDVSSVENMYAMFSNCLVFNQDISNWDVSKVTNMGIMFENARDFLQDLSSWHWASNHGGMLRNSGMENMKNYWPSGKRIQHVI